MDYRPETEEEMNQDHYEQARNFANWQYETIARYVTGNVIEIGSGNGRITRLLYSNRRVESITGVETNKKYLKNVNLAFREWKEKPLRFACVDISRTVPANLKGAFDTVVSINVLEHIKDDVQTIKNCRHLLKSGGRIVLLVPGIKMLYGEPDKAQNHYRRFSRRELREKLTEGGFRTEKIFPMNFFGVFAWLYHSKILRLRVHPTGDIQLFDRMVPLFRFFEAVFPVPFGLSYIAIGKKN